MIRFYEREIFLKTRYGFHYDSCDRHSKIIKWISFAFHSIAYNFTQNLYIIFLKDQTTDNELLLPQIVKPKI